MIQKKVNKAVNCHVSEGRSHVFGSQTEALTFVDLSTAPRIILVYEFNIFFNVSTNKYDKLNFNYFMVVKMYASIKWFMPAVKYYVSITDEFTYQSREILF